MTPLLFSLFGCQEAGFTVYDTPPTADITAPTTGAIVWQGLPLELTGLVHDAQTEDADLSVSWAADFGAQPEATGIDASRV